MTKPKPPTPRKIAIPKPTMYELHKGYISVSVEDFRLIMTSNLNDEVLSAQTKITAKTIAQLRKQNARPSR